VPAPGGRTPKFLDISDRVVAGGEQGLLGLATLRRGLHQEARWRHRRGRAPALERSGRAGGTTPTFGVFVRGGGIVPFDPAANRIFVRVTDVAGATRGSTSVAIRTQ